MVEIFSHPKRYFSPAEIKLADKMSEEESGKFAEDILKSLVNDYISFEGEETVVVVNADTPKSDKIEDLGKNGMPATVIAVNNRHFFDERDVALLHIDVTDLPALALSEKETLLSVGAPIFTIGFPGTATFGEKDFTESTFTKGLISALKNSKDESFKLYQSDAKISQGSSGSPLFSGDGRVSGVVTFQTSELSDSKGDNFAFAIPVSIIKKMLSAAKVEVGPGSYETHFKQGVGLLHARHCEKALAEFDQATKTNEKFSVAQYVEPYITLCNDMVKNGLSIDTTWDEYRDNMRGWGIVMWSLVIGAPIAIVLLVIILVVAVRRLRKDEKIMKNIADDHGRHQDEQA